MSDEAPTKPGLSSGPSAFDPDGMGFVDGITAETGMWMNRGAGWMARLDGDEVTAVHLTASSDGPARRVTLNVTPETADENAAYWANTGLTPQAALRLVEQLLTATQHALAEERWSPEHQSAAFAYDLTVVEPDADTGGAADAE